MEHKPGIKSSEFWVTAAVVIGGLLVSSGFLPSTWAEVLGLVVAAIGAGTYTISRSGVKKSPGVPPPTPPSMSP